MKTGQAVPDFSKKKLTAKSGWDIFFTEGRKSFPNLILRKAKKKYGLSFYKSYFIFIFAAKNDNMEKELLELKQKLLWQMTGEEFLRLCELGISGGYVNSNESSKETTTSTIEKARNLGELALKLGCGYTTISELKKKGVLDDAVTNTIGNRNVYDVSAARKLVDKYYCNRKAVVS